MEISSAFLTFFECRLRYAILMGGAGSGKSVVTAQKILVRITTETGHRILCVRKVGTTLRGSVFQLFVDLINKYEIADEFTIHKTEMRFTHNPSGNEIVLAGMDDPEKIKSIAGITGVWCEEATELDERDFNQLELRVRGETEHYKQFVVTFNPIDEGHWLKKRFDDKRDDQTYFMRSTFKDNPFLDDDYVKHLTERVISNENLYKVYVLGQWGRATVGGEFYKCFLFSKHVKEVKYNPLLPLHITFDFNVNPYMTCCIWQVLGRRAYQIAEICLPDPNNTTKAVCKQFCKIFHGHDAGLFVYGDPAGRHEDTRTEKGYNDYTIITQELSDFKPTLRVSKSAPAVVMRGMFIDAIFERNFEDIQIAIDPTCKKTIDDYSYLKEASEGGKLKEKAVNPDTKVPYEKYGHTSDANDYFLCVIFASEFGSFARGGSKFTVRLGKPALSKNGY